MDSETIKTETELTTSATEIATKSVAGDLDIKLMQQVSKGMVYDLMNRRSNNNS